jgi:hypothetical protein
MTNVLGAEGESAVRAGGIGQVGLARREAALR